MKPLRAALDNLHPYFEKGAKFEKLYPLYEAADTFLYTPGEVTKGASHVRDGIDLKRIMISVAVALFPCILMALYNTGLQANIALANMGLAETTGWRADVIGALGVGYNSASILANFVHGALYFIPIFLVTQIAGGFWEVLFAIVRKHEVNEGFLVTGMLFPLTLPPTIPLWQVAVGISFGVVLGKEVFGGTGKNFLNPALTARAFLFFAYPAQISGDAVWTAVDGFTGATALGAAAIGGAEGIVQNGYTWIDSFLGFVPGSMGETSALACLFGAVVLIASGIGSWRVMVGMLFGGLFLSSLLYSIGSDTNPMFSVSPAWHLVIGSFAFGLVFMATDPVSSAMTKKGMWVYGALIGVMAILVRSLNPAFPEGVMLAILFGNLFAPLIDYYVVKANIKRRQVRTGVAS
ncbi:NADH:ubiquinone reductase (Na(+)-transporting) subunit B [Pseudobacteriovorax antillogorgiicola]|uniref:Na(+)-translocating NADH-quinone reductase subunit B n=1 Tax=Pseudobacteriovorax antillogorgiicola TaxID=1513793 RepID=A0A1Y6BIU2_9BACT|nr:NADH:ubiquinone reductase (Na(+)-transporting) subunit B [Pseudobacteriovorax antillogorgiicola]TCS55493.1 Na+-transporting NADH:ubiquinone oxidoreductase subunit B [Pseudobacteriovorax antillogorgiicola]SMF11749.1 Na+-transporting NADH:ubiquinone oxidoreductase subunit B [Pseudobacteriovorax antillogorgiicola]